MNTENIKSPVRKRMDLMLHPMHNLIFGEKLCFLENGREMT